jgi:hypothetical protein
MRATSSSMLKAWSCSRHPEREPAHPILGRVAGSEEEDGSFTPWLRKRCATSNPSMSGMMMSSTARSGEKLSAASSASRPLPATPRPVAEGTHATKLSARTSRQTRSGVTLFGELARVPMQLDRDVPMQLDRRCGSIGVTVANGFEDELVHLPHFGDPTLVDR